jgi:hypothetical protein
VHKGSQAAAILRKSVFGGAAIFIYSRWVINCDAKQQFRWSYFCKARNKRAERQIMKYPELSKIIAIVAASLILPGLSLAGVDNGKGNNGQNNGNQNGNGGHGDPTISSVPEANPGIVLIPFVGAVLLVSWFQLSRMKAQKDGSLS